MINGMCCRGRALAKGLFGIPPHKYPCILGWLHSVLNYSSNLEHRYGACIWHLWMTVRDAGEEHRGLILTGVFCCALGRMLLNDSKKGPAHLHYRRPYGCAVLSILDVLQSLTELKEEKDFVLKVYT